MGFIDNGFLLHGNIAKELYSYAQTLPIIDYHCHLDARLIAEDARFSSITELMLGGDHYKWRLMRLSGVDERLITGDGGDYEKFLAFVKILPYAAGNPLYHWTHLELLRCFDIEEPLCEKNCRQIYDRCNALLADKGFSARNIIRKFGVEAICTTDDPADTLKYHISLRDEDFSVKVLPTFRPDRFLNVEKPQFADIVKSVGVFDFDGLLSWLSARLDYFMANGCLLSDHAFGHFPAGMDMANYANAKTAFESAFSGKPVLPSEADAYKLYLFGYLAKKYSRLGITMQIHIGATRNNNSVMFGKLGADTGFDSVGDSPLAEPLSAFLDSLEKDDSLPKTVLYSLNPGDNIVIGSMCGNFAKAYGAGETAQLPMPSKLQFGSAWWFNDHLGGMRAQLTALSEVGSLGGFIGMLTDSRSFVSYTRHEYFRRIFCDFLGEMAENGEFVRDEELLRDIVYRVSYGNVRAFLGI